MTASSLARTPLYSLIQAQKAKFTEFSGWEMPVQFTGLKQEHLAVRSQVGMFDISHMGKFIFTGDHPLQSLDRLVPSDLSRLTPDRAQYTVLLNPEGGIIDDVIIYDQGPAKTVMIVNAATKDKDKTWLLSQLDPSQIHLTDVSDDKVLIALQGPQAMNILQSLVKNDLTALPTFGQLETDLLGDGAFIARTGY
ncbi:MAG: glycine cleavage system aminomethyltransferase GcvT, partial [Microcystaceae cyanobacterium]